MAENQSIQVAHGLHDDLRHMRLSLWWKNFKDGIKACGTLYKKSPAAFIAGSFLPMAGVAGLMAGLYGPRHALGQAMSLTALGLAMAFVRLPDNKHQTALMPLRIGFSFLQTLNGPENGSENTFYGIGLGTSIFRGVAGAMIPQDPIFFRLRTAIGLGFAVGFSALAGAATCLFDKHFQPIIFFATLILTGADMIPSSHSKYAHLLRTLGFGLLMDYNIGTGNLGDAAVNLMITGRALRTWVQTPSPK